MSDMPPIEKCHQFSARSNKSFQSPFVRWNFASPYSVTGSVRSRSCFVVGAVNAFKKLENSCFPPPTRYLDGAANGKIGLTLVTMSALQRIRNNIRDSALSLSLHTAESISSTFNKLTRSIDSPISSGLDPPNEAKNHRFRNQNPTILESHSPALRFHSYTWPTVP